MDGVGFFISAWLVGGLVVGCAAGLIWAFTTYPAATVLMGAIVVTMIVAAVAAWLKERIQALLSK